MPIFEKSKSIDILPATDTIDLTCRIRAGVFEILDQSSAIDAETAKKAESLLTECLGKSNFTNGLILKMVETTLAAELPGLLNLPNHEVKVVRAGEQDSADGAFVVRLTPEKKN